MFHLVLVGELLAIALTLVDRGIVNFNWYRLGVLSMLIQWIVLTSAACLCPLRRWFRNQDPMVAGATSYAVVMAITLLYSILAASFDSLTSELDWDKILTNFLLAGVFSGIVLRYFYLQQQLRNQQQAELEARIQALQSRIRPHFLFNSMNSIASLIDFDPKAAEAMVVDLSDLFRASLSEPGLIPLAREIELCKRFASIEQTRMGDRLKMDWRLSSLADAEIPSLMLQPLIENAIYHGVEPTLSGGTVRVIVLVENNMVSISVCNPKGEGGQLTSKGNGMALDNIRNRLEAHYGSNGRLTVVSRDDEFEVSLKFPAVAGEKPR